MRHFDALLVLAAVLASAVFAACSDAHELWSADTHPSVPSTENDAKTRDAKTRDAKTRDAKTRDAMTIVQSLSVPATAQGAVLDSVERLPHCAAEDATCLLPWPSSRYLVHDSSTATGYRIELPAALMPANVMGVPVSPGPWNRADGFSPMSSVVLQLDGRIASDQLNDWKQIRASLLPNSRTILLDATNREMVPHFAEIQEGADVDPTKTTLYIRPAARLSENHHYVVAIRNLRLENGGWLVGGDGAARFDYLVDHAPRGPLALATRVLVPLVAAGVPLHDLILAWDFHTGSGEPIWRDLVAMRDDADALAGSSGLRCDIDAVIENPEDPLVFRRLEGRFRVPLYLEADAPGALLHRDETGLPSRNGYVDAPFMAIIPRSVASSVASGGPGARVVTFGHGLFMSRSEILDDAIEPTANDQGLVVVSTDMQGLAAGDQAYLGAALCDLNQFPAVVDRVRQSLISTLLLARSFSVGCAEASALFVGGRPLVSQKERYYYGNSQGGILGITLAALSTDTDRFALGVGGIAYPVMLPRSVDWPPLDAIVATFYPRRIERDLLTVMFGHHWDLIEGATFAPHVLRDPLPGGHVQRVLFQVGINDAGTPTVAGEIAGRTLGLRQPKNSVARVFGLPTYVGDADSAYIDYDYGVPDLPNGPVPPSADNGVHLRVRRDPRAQQQIGAFLRPEGRVVDTCGGPCGPLP